MTTKRTASEIVAPQGMRGIAVEPWTPGEIYAVAANWSQAACPVYYWGDGDWVQWGRQVADFRHDDRDALESLILEAVRDSGDDPDEVDVAEILKDAVDVRTWELGEMVETLHYYGEWATGNGVDDTAQEWLDCGFDADTADAWLGIGVWDAATAETFRDAGKSPEQIAAAAESLVEGLDDPTDEYTDGDPIYSACNGDTDPQEIIDACEN